MANQLVQTQKQMSDSLVKSLDNAATIITRNYLSQLTHYGILAPSEEDLDIDIASCGKFYRLSRLVINKEENFLDKLTTVINVVSSAGCSLATIIRSDGEEIEFYLGILSKAERGSDLNSINRRAANAAAFRGAMTGNFIGSDVEEISESELNQFRKEVFSNSGNCYSAVSGIVALRDEEHKQVESYVQGIENLVDSLMGQKYTILMLADPVGSSEIQTMRQGYEQLYTELSSFLKTSLTLQQTDSLSLATARTDGITEGISKGIAMTQSRTTSSGRYRGVNASIGANILGFGLQVGAGTGVNTSISDTSGQTYSTAEIRQRNQQVSRTVQTGVSAGKSLQLNYENRSVQSLLERIDQYLKRLDACENFGAFDCAAYIIADNKETSFAVASNYHALMRGKDSNIQASFINTWYKKEDTCLLRQYLSCFVHPRFRSKQQNEIIVTPASIISGEELAIQIGLPKKSVSGVTVVPIAPFGRNIDVGSCHSLNLGHLYHMGRDEGGSGHLRPVAIDIDSLGMHTFITGSTGSGKSTVIYSMLEQLMNKSVSNSPADKIKFLVIEPAKGEYKHRFGYYKNVQVYGTNAQKTPLLRINPFSFPKDVHLLEHIERLIEIFNVCWPMYAAMPAVLKDAVERAYVACGWSLDTSVCRILDSKGNPLYPNFVDVLTQINTVMNESQYSADSKGDYKGALSTRIKSLTNGLYRQIFTADEIPAKELFDENVIVDLSRTASSETRALIMGLLVMKLQEYRMSCVAAPNQPLRHITVLEEAHHILKRTSMEQNSESSNLLGKSVEMLSNSIAEMRTYGEGFIIADQAPGLIDLAAIRNTNTKIILRLPDFSDRQLVGASAGLNQEQITELSRLNTLVAAVYQNDWLEPVLCHIVPQFKENRLYLNPDCRLGCLSDKQRLVQFLLMPPIDKKQLEQKQIMELTDILFKMPVSAEVKLAFCQYARAQEKKEVQQLRGLIIRSLFPSETVFRMADVYQSNIQNWYQKVNEGMISDLTSFNEQERQKIIAVLLKEKADREQTKQAETLLERYMAYI